MPTESFTPRTRNFNGIHLIAAALKDRKYQWITASCSTTIESDKVTRIVQDDRSQQLHTIQVHHREVFSEYSRAKGQLTQTTNCEIKWHRSTMSCELANDNTESFHSYLALLKPMPTLPTSTSPQNKLCTIISLQI
jgi:hypothetical protein